MIDDTEAGLELPPLEESQTVEEKEEEKFGDEALKVEFDQAVNAAAEERAQSPFLAAAQTHAMIWNGFAEMVSGLTSADLKRLVMYQAGYPFYVKDLGTDNQKALATAFRFDRLCQAKGAMILCRAIEQETRVAQALDAQEALIQPLNLEQPIEKESADNTVEIKGE